eukprot:COSAG01_NODE_3298_length_6297_cov_68.182317_1_plen_155_part_00
MFADTRKISGYHVRGLAACCAALLSAFLAAAAVHRCMCHRAVTAAPAAAALLRRHYALPPFPPFPCVRAAAAARAPRRSHMLAAHEPRGVSSDGTQWRVEPPKVRRKRERSQSPFNVFESRGIKASDTTRRGKSFTFANVVIQAWWTIATTSPS